MSDFAFPRSQPPVPSARATAAHERALLREWTGGNPVLFALFRPLFGERVPSDDDQIRQAVLEVFVGARRPGVEHDTTQRAVALRMLEQRTDRSPDACAALAYFAASKSEPVRMRERALAALCKAAPLAGRRLAYALSLLSDPADMESGLNTMAEAHPKAYFYRAHELFLCRQLPAAFFETVLAKVDLLRSRRFTDAPEMEREFGACVAPSECAEVLRLSGILPPCRRLMDDAEQLVRVLSTSPIRSELPSPLALLSSCPRLREVTVAAMFARRGPAADPEARTMLRAFAPITARALGV